MLLFGCMNTLRLCHHMQVTRRWMNFEGVGVPRHLAQQLAALDALDRASADK